MTDCHHLPFKIHHHCNLLSKKNHHQITYEGSFHRSLRNHLYVWFHNGKMEPFVRINFWFLWFTQGQVQFSDLESESVYGEEIKVSRSQDLKSTEFESIKLRCNFDRSFISISNHRKNAPINILKCGLRPTMFRLVRLSLSLGRLGILISNSYRGLSLDPIGSRFRFAGLG